MIDLCWNDCGHVSYRRQPQRHRSSARVTVGRLHRLRHASYSRHDAAGRILGGETTRTVRHMRVTRPLGPGDTLLMEIPVFVGW